MHILVAGGTGYIGSHATLGLIEHGHSVLIVDNLVNSSRKALGPLGALARQEIDFIEMDLCNGKHVQALFKAHAFDAVMHFAGLKAVGESVELPEMYYRNNVLSTLNLARASVATGVNALIFSSSATVYAETGKPPFSETAALAPSNPYGRSKLICEMVLRDISAANPEFNTAILRYFNPVGAHKSGNIGEDPAGIPNNLFPYVAQVAVGRMKALTIHGQSYPTPDGTGVRDYIHVLDLVDGHICALNHLMAEQNSITVNLGTGSGYSVLDVVKAFEKASGHSIPYQIGPPREGDIAISLANADHAKTLLNWQAKHDLEDMCADHWRWQHQNPKGF